MHVRHVLVAGRVYSCSITALEGRAVHNKIVMFTRHLVHRTCCVLKITRSTRKPWQVIAIIKISVYVFRRILHVKIFRLFFFSRKNFKNRNRSNSFLYLELLRISIRLTFRRKIVKGCITSNVNPDCSH